MNRVRGLLWKLMVVAVSALSLTGCSEKGGLYRWDPVHPAGKFALPGVAALSTDEVLCVGYGYPAEGALALQMRSVRYTASGWTSVQVPGHVGESAQLLAAVKAADGTVWACGGARSVEADLSGTTPVVYHYSGGAWSEVSLASAGDVTGALFTAIAAGPDGEVRVVGPALSGHALVLKYSNGAWAKMPLPDPVGGGNLEWTLNAIARSPDGVWYAAGGSDLEGLTGGALFRDTSSGWEAIAGPGSGPVNLSALAFDASGDLWVAGNYPLADSTQGILYHRTASGFQQVPILLARAGTYRIFTIAFGPEGRGWVAGGRTPDDPFFAGTISTSAWEEVVEKDIPLPTAGSGAVKEEGGEIYGLGLLGGNTGWASGNAEESEGEGGVDFVPRVFRLLPAEEESERGAPGRLVAPALAVRRPR
jgi:hypothetical protein